MKKTILKAVYCIHLLVTIPFIFFSSIGVFATLPNALFGNRTLLDSFIFIGLIPSLLYGFSIYFIIQELSKNKPSGSKFIVYNVCIFIANCTVLLSTVNEMGY